MKRKKHVSVKAVPLLLALIVLAGCGRAGEPKAGEPAFGSTTGESHGTSQEAAVSGGTTGAGEDEAGAGDGGMSSAPAGRAQPGGDLVYRDSIPTEHAELFTIDEYEGGYLLITVEAKPRSAGAAVA